MSRYQNPVEWCWGLVFAMLPMLAFGQVNAAQSVDSLRFVTDMPYICDGGEGCGDRLFWTVVKQQKSVVPLLIDRLNDTTETAVYVPNFGGLYTVADVAYYALEEIIHGIPTFKLLGVKFDQKILIYLE